MVLHKSHDSPQPKYGGGLWFPSWVRQCCTALFKMYNHPHDNYQSVEFVIISSITLKPMTVPGKNHGNQALKMPIQPPPQFRLLHYTPYLNWVGIQALASPFQNSWYFYWPRHTYFDIQYEDLKFRYRTSFNSAQINERCKKQNLII